MKHVDEAGNLQKARNCRRCVNEREQAVASHKAASAGEQEGKAGGIDKTHVLAIDDDAPRTAINQGIDVGAQRRRRRDVDIARRGENRYVIPLTHMHMLPASKHF